MSVKRKKTKNKGWKEVSGNIRMEGLQHTRPTDKAKWQFNHRPYTNRRQG